MAVCKHVTYSGRVQGVGFRYTAQHLARGFAVAGYVRNLANGNVELVAEGEEREVEAFLQAVARQMAGSIHGSTVVDETPGSFRGFQIRY
jgi:acylphosphatase